MKSITIILFIVFFLLSAGVNGQKVFTNSDSLISFALSRSSMVKSDAIKIEQAQMARKAALISIPDLSGNLLSGSFTYNAKLPVIVLPGESFGGEPGSVKRIESGVPYTTSENSYVDVKLLNANGWQNLKMAQGNIELQKSNAALNRKSLAENVLENYYGIVSLQQQLVYATKNKEAADTLNTIVKNKFNQGQAKQQEVNDSKVSYLQSEERLRQLNFLLDQYYLCLKILCDIPFDEEISIKEQVNVQTSVLQMVVKPNHLRFENSLLQEKYALNSYKSAKAAFLPSISFQYSNTSTLYNTEFKVFDGNWVNSSYMGLKLSIPIPTSNTISQRYNAEFNYKVAKANTQQTIIHIDLEAKKLSSEFDKSLSQARSNESIFDLQCDTYAKNLLLYQEGVVSLEQTLNSYFAMVNAGTTLISSKADVELVKAKIEINNKMNSNE